MAVPSKYIQSVVKAAKGRPKSTDWYRDKIREFGTPKALDLIRDGKQATSPFFGRLNMFFYDPKLKTKLPYYDRFPLVLPLEEYNDGFLGINFHYLPIPLRMKLLDRVVDFSNNTKFDKSTTLNVSYNALKRTRLIKPTIKRYLAGKVKSRFRRVDADEFTVATLLPVARFSKATAATVHRDSRKML
tara:strand:+ start:630 stop:1190 length:561 start_codon:yes stop_codon:yes gene_type:complete